MSSRTATPTIAAMNTPHNDVRTYFLTYLQDFCQVEWSWPAGVPAGFIIGGANSSWITSIYCLRRFTYDGDMLIGSSGKPFVSS